MSVLQHLFPESTSVSDVSFVDRRVVELVSGHPRAFGQRCTVGVLDPPVCHRVQGDSVAKSQPILCVGWSRSCVLCSHDRVELRILTPLLDWKRCSSSQSSPFSGICIVRSNISARCGCSLQPVILFDTFISSHISSECYHCLLDAVSQSIFSTQMQICFLFGRLTYVECCRCPWTSLNSSRLRDTRCTSCQLFCEHFQQSSECHA